MLFTDACLGVNHEDKITVTKSGEQLSHGREEAVTREGHPWVPTHHVLFLELYDYSLCVYNIILNM